MYLPRDTPPAHQILGLVNRMSVLIPPHDLDADRVLGDLLEDKPRLCAEDAYGATWSHVSNLFEVSASMPAAMLERQCQAVLTIQKSVRRYFRRCSQQDNASFGNDANTSENAAGEIFSGTWEPVTAAVSSNTQEVFVSPIVETVEADVLWIASGPKRPPAAYFLFVADCKEKTQASCSKEAASKIQQRWQTMDPQVK